ncbi:MAG TPA: DUF2796 domain-containing protein [Nitrosospira sp.]|nr:DUF2796 domain-containing protein [Nitrosospira sp.]
MRQSLRWSGFSDFLDFSKKTMLAAGLAMGLAAPASAQSPGVHVHGQAALEAAVDGGTVQINLYTPLDNLVGFEHAPRTAEEHRAIRAMAAKLHRGDTLFVFTPSAGCRLESTHLQSAALSPELLAVVPPSGKNQGSNSRERKDEASKPAFSLSSPPSDAHEAHGVDETHELHGELEAAWVFHCSAPQELQEFDVGLFRAFPGLRRLDAAVAGPKKQSSVRLTPRSTRVQWR